VLQNRPVTRRTAGSALEGLHPTNPAVGLPGARWCWLAGLDPWRSPCRGAKAAARAANAAAPARVLEALPISSGGPQSADPASLREAFRSLPIGH